MLTMTLSKLQTKSFTTLDREAYPWMKGSIHVRCGIVPKYQTRMKSLLVQNLLVYLSRLIEMKKKV